MLFFKRIYVLPIMLLLFFVTVATSFAQDNKMLIYGMWDHECQPQNFETSAEVDANGIVQVHVIGDAISGVICAPPTMDYYELFVDIPVDVSGYQVIRTVERNQYHDCFESTPSAYCSYTRSGELIIITISGIHHNGCIPNVIKATIDDVDTILAYPAYVANEFDSCTEAETPYTVSTVILAPPTDPDFLSSICSTIIVLPTPSPDDDRGLPYNPDRCTYTQSSDSLTITFSGDHNDTCVPNMIVTTINEAGKLIAEVAHAPGGPPSCGLAVTYYEVSTVIPLPLISVFAVTQSQETTICPENEDMSSYSDCEYRILRTGLDVNCDNDWNLLDVILLKQFNAYLLDGYDPTSTSIAPNMSDAYQMTDCDVMQPNLRNFKTCDLNGDGHCGLLDTVIIQQCDAFISNEYCEMIG